MSTTMMNHKRPSLNDQINRLDQILDGLAEGLNDAVATAVTEAVVKATETVLREMLKRPELWQAAAVASASADVVGASIGPRRPLWRRAWTGLKALVAASRRFAVKCVVGVRRTVTSIPRVTASRVVRMTMTAASLALLIWRVRRSVPLAVSIGLATSALTYLATPAMTAALQGVNAVILAFLARLVLVPRSPRVATAT